ncbi:nuclear protein 1 [Manis javanica]|uniref:nuclear protein 1 n=1 Tax=Manis javanica TaxID=9974 RepID=UPI0008131A6E|nr:nuclear protein 1 [Manis javanica]XP_036848464.1 nuclear protein 1-like isoform X1 [Manis javanica]
MWPYKLGPVNWEMLGKQTQTSFRLRERDGKSKLDIMAPFPRAASLTQQPPGPKDEDPSLDDYDLYSLAHSFLGVGGRKGRTKKEAVANTNRHNPGGHERKLLTKLRNTERKRQGARP